MTIITALLVGFLIGLLVSDAHNSREINTLNAALEAALDLRQDLVDDELFMDKGG